MLVGAGEEHDVVAPEAAPPGEDVRGDGRVRVPDVGHVVHVVDRRRQEEGVGHPAYDTDRFPRLRAIWRPARITSAVEEILGGRSVSSGVSRKVDRLGRVVLPAELRKQLEIREGDLIEIAVDDDGRIVLEKVAQRCVFCRATAGGRAARVRGQARVRAVRREAHRFRSVTASS